MDDKFKYGQNDENSFDRQERSNHEQNSAHPNESSYYYSYGPFKSVRQEGEREPEDVIVTPPQPIKPIPQMHEMNNAFFGDGSNGSDGSSNRPNMPANAGNWQYNARPRTSLKTVVASFLAGMIVISSLMFAADRTNLFTPDKEATTQSVDSTSSEQSAPATAASMNITNQNDVISVVKEASPAVVKIETLQKQSSRSSSNPYFNDPMYRFFFGDGFGGDGGSGNDESGNGSGSQQNNTLVPVGIGSGFIFDKSGYILTNEHVVHGADEVQVTLENSKKTYEAKVLGTSYELDLAVLKIDGNQNFPYIQLGDSQNAQVGEWLVAIGNPQGFDHSVTAGVLSSKERSITIPGENGEPDRQYEHLLQTDASINPGNSGGPLLDLHGQVIGMNVAVSSDAQGIGFAIPSSTIKEVLDKLKNNQEIPKKPVPFIGAELMNLTEDLAKQLGTNVTEGSVVGNVIFKSPAYQADLRAYDIIVGINGTKYSNTQDLIDFIQKQTVGSQVTLNIIRDGKNMDLKVTIGDRNKFTSANSNGTNGGQ
ncbi:trypsin-like peptidase domain-containing protein [Paenibacillus sediminis]|uniref:S1-C subfamily serine protease n=1 Tax=Paenibacillus sediminis TaxID=664909 RepID=A0ABS4H7W6_9BACL|nr:trypsin-like peptidase domain-containing protein [Paenibacillus sediminis]MBP1938627.1 S1-C subfamily serine protease [Paenibacillus sediminis]